MVLCETGRGDPTMVSTSVLAAVEAARGLRAASDGFVAANRDVRPRRGPVTPYDCKPPTCSPGGLRQRPLLSTTRGSDPEVPGQVAAIGRSFAR